MTKPPNINDMTTARAWAEHIVNTPETSLPMETAAANALMALLPPRPTLADMTAEEREACDGMQADLAQGDRVIILYGTVDTDGLVQVLESTLDVYRPRPADVTPRPDLPRFVWPGGTPETPAPAPAMPDGWRLADHPDYGRVVVTTENQERDGYVYFTFPDDDVLGYEWHFCRPDVLTYIDQGIA